MRAQTAAKPSRCGLACARRAGCRRWRRTPDSRLPTAAVERELLGHVTDPLARRSARATQVHSRHAQGPAGSGQQSAEHAKRSGLARAVGTEQAEDLAPLNIETDMVNGTKLPNWRTRSRTWTTASSSEDKETGRLGGLVSLSVSPCLLVSLSCLLAPCLSSVVKAP